MSVPSPLPRAARRQNHRFLRQRIRPSPLRRQNEQALHLRADVAERKDTDLAEFQVQSQSEHDICEQSGRYQLRSARGERAHPDIFARRLQAAGSAAIRYTCLFETYNEQTDELRTVSFFKLVKKIKYSYAAKLKGDNFIPMPNNWDLVYKFLCGTFNTVNSKVKSTCLCPFHN